MLLVKNQKIVKNCRLKGNLIEKFSYYSSGYIPLILMANAVTSFVCVCLLFLEEEDLKKSLSVLVNLFLAIKKKLRLRYLQLQMLLQLSLLTKLFDPMHAVERLIDRCT